jgi:hypothetical protein
MHSDRCCNTRRQKYHAKGSRKETKYKSLYVETKRMWNMKCMIVLVITGATGVVRKG